MTEKIEGKIQEDSFFSINLEKLAKKLFDKPKKKVKEPPGRIYIKSLDDNVQFGDIMMDPKTYTFYKMWGITDKNTVLLGSSYMCFSIVDNEVVRFGDGLEHLKLRNHALIKEISMSEAKKFIKIPMYPRQITIGDTLENFRLKLPCAKNLTKCKTTMDLIKYNIPWYIWMLREFVVLKKKLKVVSYNPYIPYAYTDRDDLPGLILVTYNTFVSTRQYYDPSSEFGGWVYYEPTFQPIPNIGEDYADHIMRAERNKALKKATDAKKVVDDMKMFNLTKTTDRPVNTYFDKKINSNTPLEKLIPKVKDITKVIFPIPLKYLDMFEWRVEDPRYVIYE